MIEMVDPVLNKDYIEQGEKSFIMNDGVLLAHNKCAKYATDV